MSGDSGGGHADEFQYSTSGSEDETEDARDPTKSVVNVFKGFHVAGKYKYCLYVSDYSYVYYD